MGNPRSVHDRGVLQRQTQEANELVVAKQLVAIKMIGIAGFEKVPAYLQLLDHGGGQFCVGTIVGAVEIEQGDVPFLSCAQVDSGAEGDISAGFGLEVAFQRGATGP